MSPTDLAIGLANPAKLDDYHAKQVLAWIDLRKKIGFELVSTPTRAHMTPCLDFTEEPGSMWVIVAARFFYHGVQGTLTGDDMQELKEYAAEIGAEKPKKNPGTATWLEGMTPEQAAATVQAMAPRKEYDDDPI